MALASRRIPISSRADFALSVVKYVYDVPVNPARYRGDKLLVSKSQIEQFCNSLLCGRYDGCNPRSCLGSHSSAHIHRQFDIA